MLSREVGMHSVVQTRELVIAVAVIKDLEAAAAAFTHDLTVEGRRFQGFQIGSTCC